MTERNRCALAALALMVGLSGCLPTGETGFVEIKTVPSSSAATLYLDDTKLEPIKSAGTVLRRRVGTARLQTDIGFGKFSLICELVVRKDRITSVTVSVLERPLRCQCRAVDTTAQSGRACVG